MGLPTPAANPPLVQNSPHTCVRADSQPTPASIANDQIPVHMYGLGNGAYNRVPAIGSPLIDAIRRLGIAVSPAAMDFLSISLGVIAADTFVPRRFAADGWTRVIRLRIPLIEPKPWDAQKPKLEQALHFLSGDMWRLEFEGGGFVPPAPYGVSYHLANLRGLDCVSLLSGGLDSAVGAIDLLHSGSSPLFVSS